MYGGDIIPKDINASIATTKTKEPSNSSIGAQMDSSHNQISTTNRVIAKVMRACCMIFNSTAINEVFSRLDHNSILCS